MTTTSVYAITVDCADAARLAGFWAEVLEATVDDGADAAYAAIASEPKWMFMQVPEGKQAKNRVHVDLRSSNPEGELKRIVDLGARRLADFSEDGARWTTLVDPEGNEFDLIFEGA